MGITWSKNTEAKLSNLLLLLMSIHAVKIHQSHLAWDNSIQPVLRVKSGETVKFDCLDASNGQITKDSTSASISSLVFSQLDAVHGPVYIEGASPGDTLQIDVLSMEPADWGWTALIPGFGLLTDEFPEPYLKIWSLDRENGCAYFDESKTIRIPLRPFAGEMGLARGVSGAFSTIPPYATGGNLDTKHLGVGSTLYLPVEVEGGLFSAGDGHAAQGDGGTCTLSCFAPDLSHGQLEEVCGTAIETPMKVELRFTIRKDRPYTKAPHFKANISNTDEYYCTTGVDPDLREATRSATRSMIEFLHAEYKLEKRDAYILCSVSADLRLHEVVDMPNYVVGMMIPKSVLPSGERF